MFNFEKYRFTDRAAGTGGTALNAKTFNDIFQDIDQRMNGVEVARGDTQSETSRALADGLRQIQAVMALITGGSVPTDGTDGQTLMWLGAAYIWRALEIGDVAGLSTILAAVASQASVDTKLPISNPTPIGTVNLVDCTVNVATASPGTNSALAASCAFVKAALDALVGGAPGALDTLNELAAALGDDASYASTVTLAIGARYTKTEVDNMIAALDTDGGTF